MERSTTIRGMMARNKVFVPDYQRAYSWDTEVDSKKPPKQVNTFFADLEEYKNSETRSKYYFGHFLFEEKTDDEFGVIDGQQRLTTIVIFLTVLFRRLKCIRILTEDEEEIYEDIIKRKSKYRFSTVAYDDLVLRDYVIDGATTGKNGVETESANRIAMACDYFMDRLLDKDEEYLSRMLDSIQGSRCTIHVVTDESEAIQMFIFQNNRGKRPSTLEIIKAQFMFNIHLYAGEEKEFLINDIKERFGQIYKSISSIEYNINEDDVLAYTLRVHFNSLRQSNAIGRINELLSEGDPISFVKDFTQSIYESFRHLKRFFCEDERKYIEIHSLVSLGGIGIAIPFIIKAYKAGLPIDDLRTVCSSLESLLVRHRLIGTRADINTRLNDVFKRFTREDFGIGPVVERINHMKEVDSDSWWWAFWNNESLTRAIQGDVNHSVAKFLLWKYEIHLESQGKSGYLPSRFDRIPNPELEHIAPKVNNPKAGYDEYDDDFRNLYIDCLGNYLLLSKSHNCSIGNKPFKEKRASYTMLKQQREIQQMTEGEEVWARKHIQQRKEKIIKFIVSTV